MISLTDMLGFPLAKENPLEQERLANGERLEDVYPGDYPDSEILKIEVETPNVEQGTKVLDYYNPSEILKYIPILGKTSLHFNLKSSSSGNYQEQSYFLDIFNGKNTDEVFLGTFDNNEVPPIQQDIVEAVKKFLEKDYVELYSLTR